MADRIGGIGLLFEQDGVEYLHALYIRENGDRKPWRGHLPVRPKGSPPKEGRVTWEYTIHGDEIEVSPSVKITTNTGAGTPEIEKFHNEGLWRLKFERFTPLPELQWNDGIGDHGQRSRFIELNPGDYCV